MNFSEFKKLLGADPWNREPETLRARHSGPEFERAAREAEAFERKLQKAMEVAADEVFLEQLLEISGRPADRRLPAWIAMAASVILVAGVAGVVWLRSPVQWKNVEDYVASHYAHDSALMFELAEGEFDRARIAEVLASFDMAAGDDLAERVLFIKYCPTMDGRGAHMVVRTDRGPVQLIYMPNTRVTDREEFRFGQMQAHLVGLERGSVAIVGTPNQPVAAMDPRVRGALYPLSANT
jgi:hypothetical protein